MNLAQIPRHLAFLVRHAGSDHCKPEHVPIEVGLLAGSAILPGNEKAQSV